MALVDRRVHVIRWDPLSIEQAEVAQLARKRVIPDVTADEFAARPAGPADSVDERSGALRANGVPRPSDRFEDLVVSAGDLGLRRRSVSEPDAENVRVDRKLPLRIPDRAGQRDVVVHLTPYPQRFGDLTGRDDAAYM